MTTLTAYYRGSIVSAISYRSYAIYARPRSKTKTISNRGEAPLQGLYRSFLGEETHYKKLTVPSNRREAPGPLFLGWGYGGGSSCSVLER